MVFTTQEYKDRSDKIKEVIIKLLFKDKKYLVTEVSIKKEVNCYNVNIEKVIKDINDSALYPFISCTKNSYGVLNLTV